MKNNALPFLDMLRFQLTCSKVDNNLLQCCYFINLLKGCHLQLVHKLLNYMQDKDKSLEQVC